MCGYENAQEITGILFALDSTFEDLLEKSYLQFVWPRPFYLFEKTRKHKKYIKNHFIISGHERSAGFIDADNVAFHFTFE